MNAISRLTDRFTPVVALGAVILLVGGAGVATAATGGSFILGHSNNATTLTILTNTAGTPLRLNAPAGVAPLIVNSTGKVPNLNSDKLDGLSSEQFQRKITPLRFTPLTLVNGWTTNCQNWGIAGVAVGPDGVVHFRGGLCNADGAATNYAFNLPASLTPKTALQIVMSQCGADSGLLVLQPNGHALLDADPLASTSATCYSSLSGISYTLPY